MGRFAAGDALAADRLVAEAVRRIGAEIDALHVPRLGGVVLGGGYGRGEGGVIVAADGEERLSNDLDFYVVAEDGATGADLAAIDAALAPIAERETAALGVDVDFCGAKTPWRLRHDQERVMIQELVHGYVDVAGRPGEVLFAAVARREPSEFPWTEAARLLLNRGVGLMLAMESDDGMFAVRNVNKCILGAGDARLIVRRSYRWRMEDRKAVLGDPLYAAAVDWKFRPFPSGVCDWETARGVWLSALDEVTEAGNAAGASRRSFRRALRWLVRRRTIGDIGTFGQEPEVRVLRTLSRHVRERMPLTESLKEDWRVFN